jgi:acyl-CoA synthetase (AMP-forming)/AMP-acid ligase II
VSQRLAPTWSHADQDLAGPDLRTLFGSGPSSHSGRLVLIDPDAPGPGTSFDAAALDDVVGRLAGALRAQGIEAGATVAWQSSNRWEAVALYRACWRLGAVAAPVHHQAGPAELDHILGQLDPALVIDPDQVADLAERGQPIAGPGPEHPEDLAVVLHTSGSTGTPKGVLHTQAGLAHKAQLMSTVHGLDAGDAILMPAPLAHISGLMNAVTLPGARGMTAVLMRRWDPERALALIEAHRITFMIGPPTFFVALADAPGFAPERVASLRLISSGGAGVTPSFVTETAERFGCVVKRTYGSTEAPTVTTSFAGDDPDRARSTDGRPTGRARVRIAESGEIEVRGPEVFVGYTDPVRTREAVADGWFRTGDLGSVDDHGWLTVTGRLKDLIIRGGENIAAAEVERVLGAHPWVRQAAAVGQPDRRLGERVCAFVVCAPGTPLDLATCAAWFAECGVARFKTPEAVVVVDELPLLAAGKIDRSELTRRAAALAATP